MTATASCHPIRLLSLPPPYRLVVSDRLGSSFRDTCLYAEELRAGAFVWVPQPDLIEFAVVLEPEVPLNTARWALFCGMTALADTISSTCPPETRVSLEWPDAVNIDDIQLGGGRLGWPESCHVDDVPSWLVFSTMLTAWHEEPRCCEPLRGVRSAERKSCWTEIHATFIEGFARYFLRGFDVWCRHGSEAVSGPYLARLRSRKTQGRLALLEAGDLLVQRTQAAPAEQRSLMPALDNPSWLDANTGYPRL
jgi:hypothetical protein